MTELYDDRRRRLDLADTIRAVLHLARARADEDAETRARRLLARLAEDRFQLAVVGQFSRGKSTLMNAVLGAAYLPTGALPMTSVLTTVSYGSRPRALIRRRGSRLGVEVRLEEVARFVAQASTERSAWQVASVDIEVPAEVLRLGFAFVDTPGIGSALDVNTATTKWFVPQADAVIFVTGFDSALTAAEVEFLADVQRHVGKLFLVVNKRDLVSDREAADVLALVRRWLREETRSGQPRVFPLSALRALDARVRGHPEPLAASGLPPFETALREFLTTQKAPLFLRNIAAGTARLVSGLRRDLRLGRLTLDGGPDPRELITTVEARLEELADRQHAVADTMAGRVEADVPDLLAARATAWRSELRDALLPQVDRALSDPVDGARDIAVIARERLEESGRAIVGDWQTRRLAEAHNLLLGLVGAEISALGEASRAAGIVGAQVAGLVQPGDDVDAGGWSAEDIPVLAVPEVDWSIPLPPRRRRDQPRQRVLDAVDAAITAVEAGTRDALLEAARQWVALLRDDAVRQIHQAADRFHHNLRTLPRDEDVAVLDDLADRIASMRADLDAWSPIPAVETRPSRTPAEACVVCQRLETTLFDHLRRGQFLLATRESEQNHHAEIGGFCALHTWEYAAMGTPLGISVGYARLAEVVADELDSAARRAVTVQDLAGGVTDLVRKADGCLVCAALASAEDTAIAEIAAGTAVPTLCLRHLASTLAAGPAPEHGRAMQRVLAAALRRDSEDMRSYALKREALRRSLVSDEESHAYRDALHLLAGQPELVRPWR